MPSPFPGIDPYIESSGMWGDFHGSMVASMRNELNARLPAGYAAQIELYVWFHEPEARKRRHIEPDVYITKQKNGGRGRGGSSLAAPQTITLAAVERRRQKFVQIVDTHSRRVVTVIELLSPSNKALGDDRDVYLAKRNEVLANRVNLVEIDLLRGGQRLPLSEPPPDMEDYYVMVCRGWTFPKAEFWPLSIRDPLPEVPIPLADDVKDVLLPLQSCVGQVYEGGRYASELMYDRPLTPRLSKRDAAWAKELVTAWTDEEGHRAK